MDVSLSHEIASFIQDANWILRRLRVEGEKLSKSEIRILSAQLKELSITVNELDHNKRRNTKAA
jgi:hypothetical protein